MTRDQQLINLAKNSAVEEELLDEKKKRKPKKKKSFSSMSITTGDPKYNMDMFNKIMGSDVKAATDAVGTIAAPSPDGSSSVSVEGDGGLGESIELDEAKRYVRRYYIRPQSIFCSNKSEILKALVDNPDQNCSVYTLNNLGDEKDVTKLTVADIIYYYDEGVLYDKNHVRVMDYDLAIKREEDRAPIKPEQVSEKTFKDVYQDRMTELTDLEEETDLVESRRADWDVSAEELAPLVFASKLPDGSIQAGPTASTRDSVFKELVKQLWRDTPSRLQAAKIAKDTILKTLGLNSLDRAFETELEMMIKNMREANWPGCVEKGKSEIKTAYTGMLSPDTLLKIQQAAYAEAIVRKFFEPKLAEIKTKLASGELRALDMSEETKQKVRDWLLKNVTSIFITIPLNDAQADGTKEDLGEEVQERWDDELAAFRLRFPKARKDYDYWYRNASGEDDPRKDLWHIAAKTELSAKVKEAPDYILAMITDAKRRTKQATKSIEEMANDTYVDSYPFAKAVLALFNNDFTVFNKEKRQPPKKRNKYKTHNNEEPTKEVAQDSPFDQTFENINAFGEALTEEKEKICCICGEEINGYGNNPAPVKSEGQCCDACNIKFVIPARLEGLTKEGK